MGDTASIITILIALAIFYFIFKFIVSPAIKLIFGVLTFFVVLSVLRNIFHISFNEWLSPYGILFDVDGWLSGFDWLSNSIITYINNLIALVKTFFATKQ